MVLFGCGGSGGGVAPTPAPGTDLPAAGGSPTPPPPATPRDGREIEPAGAPVRPVERTGSDTLTADAGDMDVFLQCLGDGGSSGGPALSWSECTLRGLTLREKVGQMLMPIVLGSFSPEGSEGHLRILEYIEEYHVGGMIVSVGSPTEVAAKLNDFQGHSRLPLLIGADLETGAGFRFRGAVQMPGTIPLGGATDFPRLMALGASGDTALAYQMGRVTALEARAVGVHMPFAPVLDVNNNPANPVINVRSFGEDPATVASMGAAFVRGVQEHGAVATGKHFPGHGDTDTNSHLALPVIHHSRERMDSVELLPFRVAIDAGMGAVMSAHIGVPSLNGGDEDPATLAPGVLRTLLRDRMGFNGLVVTDAMDMYAIDRGYRRREAAVRAVEAGSDIILMPPSLSDAIDGIVDAVRSGRIPESRIDESVRRILREKERLGLHEERTVSLQDVPRSVGIPDHEAVAREIAEKSITLLRNERNLLPLRGTRWASVLSVSFRRTSDVLAGRYFNARLRETYVRLSTAELTEETSAERYAALLAEAGRSQLVVVGTYVTGLSYVENSMALPAELVDFVRALARAGVPHVVISFGNPYLVADFPGVRAYMLGWSGSEVSQVAAARALLGEIPIRGRAPIRIPPLFELGAGISMDAKTIPTGGN
ncbi:MAG: glycoside hydrolase family 3 protein [Gemmatimonadota bacterium]|nr:glycoside hydrolase family 3 protein [Gemmatimonadota bacterium]